MDKGAYKIRESNKIFREPETKTIYVNPTHLKPDLEMKYYMGAVDPYNIVFYSLKSTTRAFINGWSGIGYKVVFKDKDKVILILFNRCLY
jgi:hypothetical protein